MGNPEKILFESSTYLEHGILDLRCDEVHHVPHLRIRAMIKDLRESPCESPSASELGGGSWRKKRVMNVKQSKIYTLH